MPRFISFENHISLARQMLTGDTSWPPPLRYLRTCAKVDNTNATTLGLLAPKIRAVHASNAISLPLPLSLLLHTPSLHLSRRPLPFPLRRAIRNEMTSFIISVLSPSRTRYLHGRDIREVSAVSTGERARTPIKKAPLIFPRYRWPNGSVVWKARRLGCFLNPLSRVFRKSR